jgi:hypothetical protein
VAAELVRPRTLDDSGGETATAGGIVLERRGTGCQIAGNGHEMG